MTSTQETEAFGRTIATTGGTASPFGYHGSEGYRQEGEGPQGGEPYQKVGARYYDATFGRFITRDTELSQAPYAYCDGDPVNCSDPTGHFHIPTGIQPPALSSPLPNGNGDSGDGDDSGEGLGGPGGTDPGGPVGGAGGAGSASPAKPVVIPIGGGATLTYSPTANGGVTLTLGNQNGGLRYIFNNNYNLTGVGGFGNVPVGGGFSFNFNGGVSLGSGKTNYGYGAAYSADF